MLFGGGPGTYIGWNIEALPYVGAATTWQEPPGWRLSIQVWSDSPSEEKHSGEEKVISSQKRGRTQLYHSASVVAIHETCTNDKNIWRERGEGDWEPYGGYMHP